MAIMYRCYFFSIGTFFENVIGLSVTTIALCNLSNCLGNGGLFVVISHNISINAASDITICQSEFD